VLAAARNSIYAMPERGRALYAAHEWVAAYESFAAADRTDKLNADDLELLARSAYMLGRDGEYGSALERAYEAHLARARPLHAARCAFWIWLNLAPQGETARAAGWLVRAHRLLPPEGTDCVERGYLLIPDLLGCVATGDCDGAYAIATTAVEIGARFGDDDLLALAVMEQGHALVRQGRTSDGFRLVDELMLAATTRDLSPIVTGIVYCNTIAFCAGMYELRRAQEWTAALTRWCDEQPEMLAHTGVCLVHRAEIMEMQGAWEVALEEAIRAAERFNHGVLNRLAGGRALYRQGELCRLRGDVAAAEAAYREASKRGFEPQPGLALLRLAQGRVDAADASIRRVAAETADPLTRAGLLPAYVEIVLAAGDTESADVACRELTAIAEDRPSPVLGALAAQATGALALVQDDPTAALRALRQAWSVWHELGAPYEAARVRVLVGLACRALGDEDTAGLELEVARAAFVQLGAAPDLARVAKLGGKPTPAASSGLTRRELEVLRLVAAGSTNKAIASKLVVSERTVDRHVSNILTKVGVSSRTAAAAYAYEHQLV
jgi:DNA-binding CsgD family transcriptional regulator